MAQLQGAVSCCLHERAGAEQTELEAMIFFEHVGRVETATFLVNDG